MLVTIMCGVSGSGKSTYSIGKGEVVSADFFFQKDGIYNFDKTKLHLAHAECLRNFVFHLIEGKNNIVVDNTNLRNSDIITYYSLAKAFSYDCEVLKIKIEESDLELCEKRNLHSVDLKTLKMQFDNLQRLNLPKYIKVTELPLVR